jgi:hypothetical protein
MRTTPSAALFVALLATSGSSRALRAAPSARHEILPFIADDYPRALAAARAQSKPIFLEAWAPW